MPPLKTVQSNNISPRIVIYKKKVHEDANITGSPRYTFKRTGHNLKLVDNPDVPGVGRYTPLSELHNKAYSFNKSKREFNWKKGFRQLIQVNEFQRKFLSEANNS